MEYLKLENTGDKTKNPKDGFNRQVAGAEEKISEPEDRSEETLQNEPCRLKQVESIKRNDTLI